MEDLKEKKQGIRNQVEEKLNALSKKEISEKYAQIEEQLFDFANFREAEVTLLYINQPHEMDTQNILKRCSNTTKNLVPFIIGSPKLKNAPNNFAPLTIH